MNLNERVGSFSKYGELKPVIRNITSPKKMRAFSRDVSPQGSRPHYESLYGSPRGIFKE